MGKKTCRWIYNCLLYTSDIYSGINDDDDEIIGLEGYQQGRKVTYQVKNKEMKDNRGKYYVRAVSYTHLDVYKRQ